jgi:BirA family biotin operon repressor/biotin-[acetyl-CoA-carboxylase] ligase
MFAFMTKQEKKIIFLNEIDSTNNYANQLILSNAAEEGTIVMTQFQKKGRGQPGNGWESEAGKNLLVSFILFPEFLHAEKQFQISKAISLSIVEFLNREVDRVSIKWPNDIYVENKKIAGILIENSIKGTTLFSSIVGIGLNINQDIFVSDAPNPVSLKQLTGKEFDVKSVMCDIFELFTKWYRRLQYVAAVDIDSTYFDQLYGKEEWKTYSKQGELFEAKIVGIGEYGQLQLKNRHGIIEEFMFKEVEFVF